MIHIRDTLFSLERSGSTHFLAGWGVVPDGYHTLSSVLGSIIVVVEMMETMRNVMLVMGMPVVVKKAYTGDPTHMGMAMTTGDVDGEGSHALQAVSMKS